MASRNTAATPVAVANGSSGGGGAPAANGSSGGGGSNGSRAANGSNGGRTANGSNGGGTVNGSGGGSGSNGGGAANGSSVGSAANRSNGGGAANGSSVGTAANGGGAANGSSVGSAANGGGAANGSSVGTAANRGGAANGSNGGGGSSEGGGVPNPWGTAMDSSTNLTIVAETAANYASSANPTPSVLAENATKTLTAMNDAIDKVRTALELNESNSTHIEEAKLRAVKYTKSVRNSNSNTITIPPEIDNEIAIDFFKASASSFLANKSVNQGKSEKYFTHMHNATESADDALTKLKRIVDQQGNMKQATTKNKYDVLAAFELVKEAVENVAQATAAAAAAPAANAAAPAANAAAPAANAAANAAATAAPAANAPAATAAPAANAAAPAATAAAGVSGAAPNAGVTTNAYENIYGIPANGIPIAPVATGQPTIELVTTALNALANNTKPNSLSKKILNMGTKIENLKPITNRILQTILSITQGVRASGKPLSVSDLDLIVRKIEELKVKLSLNINTKTTQLDQLFPVLVDIEQALAQFNIVQTNAGGAALPLTASTSTSGSSGSPEVNRKNAAIAAATAPVAAAVAARPVQQEQFIPANGNARVPINTSGIKNATGRMLAPSLTDIRRYITEIKKIVNTPKFTEKMLGYELTKKSSKETTNQDRNLKKAIAYVLRYFAQSKNLPLVLMPDGADGLSRIPTLSKDDIDKLLFTTATTVSLNDRMFTRNTKEYKEGLVGRMFNFFKYISDEQIESIGPPVKAAPVQAVPLTNAELLKKTVKETGLLNPMNKDKYDSIKNIIINIVKTEDDLNIPFVKEGIAQLILYMFEQKSGINFPGKFTRPQLEELLQRNLRGTTLKDTKKSEIMQFIQALKTQGGGKRTRRRIAKTVKSKGKNKTRKQKQTSNRRTLRR